MINLNPKTAQETLALVASEPVDWVQMQLWANLSPESRVNSAMNALLFARAALRGTFETRFPDLSPAEVNMKILSHFSTLQNYFYG
jgi:hypothetical protein